MIQIGRRIAVLPWPGVDKQYSNQFARIPLSRTAQPHHPRYVPDTSAPIRDGISDRRRRASPYVFPRRLYTTSSAIQTNILASPNGEPLSSPQQAEGYPAGFLMTPTARGLPLQIPLGLPLRKGEGLARGGLSPFDNPAPARIMIG